jgi:DNA primase
MLFPPGLRRLYIVRDNDPAGQRASATLTARAQAAGVEALTLVPVLKDFNDDLRQREAAALAASVRDQLAPEDVTRFWRASEQPGQDR